MVNFSHFHYNVNQGEAICGDKLRNCWTILLCNVNEKGLP